VERRTEQRTKNPEQKTDNEPAPKRKGDDIAERLLDAVEGVRGLLPALRGDVAAKHVATQLWRATGAVAQTTKKHVVPKVARILFTRSGSQPRN
jgi:hypothetical protein